MRVIGLMSGTSMDGIDVALIDTDGHRIHDLGLASEYYPYLPPERQLLLEAVDSARGITRRDNRDGVLAIAEEMVTAKHIECVKAFAIAHSIDLATIDAIGFHGQTVIHRPEKGFSVQLGNGSSLSDALALPVVYDFRSADMQRGGQGAPLVPVFHRALAAHVSLPLPAAFVNIGGIANVTYIPEGPPDRMIAFDAGTGNCLLDDWALRHTGEPLDRDAKLALTGTVNADALQALIADPYFTAPAPKSLDRNAFTLESLENLSAADGAATLTAFTVAGIGLASRLIPELPKAWIITGGGARNPHMLEGLRRVLKPTLMTADEAGLQIDFIEAQAFAFLAARHLIREPSTFTGTTGANEPVVVGILTGEQYLKQRHMASIW